MTIKPLEPIAQNQYHKSFTGCITDHLGNRRHFINGAYGRENDLPCLENVDGAKHWYEENPKRGHGFGARTELPHRLGGPAIIQANGDTYWMRHGEMHRDDGLPAIELVRGIKKWFVAGKFIRQEIIDVAI